MGPDGAQTKNDCAGEDQQQITVLLCHTLLNPRCGLVPSCFLIKTLYTFLISS
jgi:hypothetical protein